MGNSAELIEKITGLKERGNAIILAHNYQLGEIQDIADFVGDSLELSQRAAKTGAAVIVFCGVQFMAETAAILCPDKVVLLPDRGAGCPLADVISVKSLREKKKEHPKATVVCYVNSSAAVKAESDICCTSANTVGVVNKLADAEEIIFVPDQYLGNYVATKTGRKMILWPGYCPTHVRIEPQDIIRQKVEHPLAKVVVHPECRPEVIALADEVRSTGGICSFARETEVEEIIVGTEIGIIHRLKKENPKKRFIPASEQAICPTMKLITLKKVLWSLEKMTNQVKIPERTRLRAKGAVDKMLEDG